jgi:hypothetical protein
MPEKGSSEHPFDWQAEEAESERLVFGPAEPEQSIDLRDGMEFKLEHAMAELDAIVASAKRDSNGEITPTHLKQIEQTAMTRTSTPSMIRKLTLEYLEYVKGLYAAELGSKRYLQAHESRPISESIERIDKRIQEVTGS